MRRSCRASAPRHGPTATPVRIRVVDLYGHLIARWRMARPTRSARRLVLAPPARHRAVFPALSALSARHDLRSTSTSSRPSCSACWAWRSTASAGPLRPRSSALLDQRMVVMHAIWIDGRDIRCWRPPAPQSRTTRVCNLRLGSGIMPFRRWRNAGVPLCLAPDEATVDRQREPVGGCSRCGLIHTLAMPDVSHLADGAGDLAWRSEAAPGRRAAGPHRRARTRQAGRSRAARPRHARVTPLNDLKRQLVYCENGSSARMTIVAGQIVVGRQDDDGRRGRPEARGARADGDISHGDGRCDAAARTLERYYRDMYLRATRAYVGPPPPPRWSLRIRAPEDSRR